MTDRDPIAEAVERGCVGMYGKNWDSPDDEKRPGPAMKAIWRNLSDRALAAALAPYGGLEAIKRLAEGK